MRFPPEFIDRLRNHIPISEVVGKRVPIKRHGREFHALCPFHKEKSPSFTVNDEKGFFHCFGCSAHGDAIGFIKDFEGVSYPEAVERLAIEAGLPVPQMTREAEEFERKRVTLEDVVSLAAHWFVDQLQTPAGKEARDYIHTRGLAPETVTRFGIGFAPNVRDALKTALMKQNITEAMLIETGLVAKTDDGKTYDRFRGRLMFPIRNAQGKVVAFGGRILASAETDKTAKYLNSPETPLFHKGDMLFAYDIARVSAREKGTLIVAEGYMDVIVLHQAGFTNAVAPLGTAITDSQLKLLWRAVPEPVLCLDGDEAGRRAMLRAAELALPLLKAGFGLKFAVLPGGEDPDSFIRKRGPSAMQETLGGAKILSHVLWENGLAQFGAQTAEKKAALEQHLMQTAEKIADPLVRQHVRDYFRNQVFSLKSQKKFDKSAPSIALPDALPAANDDESHLKALEGQLFTLILLQPGLLHRSEIEEYFGHMDLLQPMLDKLRRDILEVSGCFDPLDNKGLEVELAKRGHTETTGALLQHAARILPKQMHEWSVNPQAAFAAWVQTCDAYTDKIEDREIAILMRDESEDAYNKILALKKQKEERTRARYAVTAAEQAS